MEKSKDLIQRESAQVLEKFDRCSIAGSMGIGKTRIGVEDIDRHYTDYLRVLVVGPKKSTFKAWRAELVETNKLHLKDNIVYSTYLSLTKQSLDYDIVYLDEIHNLTEKHDPWLSKFKGKIRGLTGTPPKSKYSKKYKLVDKYAPVKYVYTTDEAVSDNILNDYQIIVHLLSLSNYKNLEVPTKKGTTFYTSELASYVWWTNKLEEAILPGEEQKLRLMRMKALQGFKTKEEYIPKLLRTISNKCIIFANTKDQASRVCDFSYYSGLKTSEENLELFSTGRIRRLSCIEQLSESVTIPELRESIIMHAYSSSTKAPQKIGRNLRLEPGDKATIHILCYRDTIDVDWVSSALSSFDPDKIIWKDAD